MHRSEPPLRQIQDWLAVNANAAIKLAPASECPDLGLSTVEWNWVGYHDECSQLVAWCGELARSPGSRVASLVLNDGTSAEWIGEPQTPTFAAELGQFIYEPHACVLAADLSHHMAGEFGLQAITRGGGYLTGSEINAGPLLAAYRILDCVPFDRRRVKNTLKQLGGGRVTVKKRGVNCNPSRLQSELAGDGDASLTVIITRFRERVLAVIAEFVVPPA